ncbi:MAG: hypothetical protein AB1611_12950 [bacterium]
MSDSEKWLSTDLYVTYRYTSVFSTTTNTPENRKEDYHAPGI